MPLKIDMDKSPKAQLEALRNRQKLITTSKWNELEKEAHDKAFTVAKVMSADVLQDIYDYVQSAVKEGWSYDTFKKKVRDGGLVERMQNAGWLKTATDKQIGARLQVIIDTNVKMAYGKGNYNRLMLVKDKKPYWIYHQTDRKTKRIEHAKLNGRKFHCDDPIWNTIYPPSAFRCSCWVEAVAEPDGVENGEDVEIKPGEHPISPLTAWKPDTLKYVEGIGKVLDEMLNIKTPQHTIKESLYSADDDLRQILEAKNDFKNNESNTDYYDEVIKPERRKYDNTLSEKTLESLTIYREDGYKKINKDIREGRSNEHYQAIKDGDMSYEFSTDRLLYRGEWFDSDVELAKRLRTIYNGTGINQLFSSSYDINKSLKFSHYYSEVRHSIIFRIKTIGTHKITFGTTFEREIIFDKGSKYKIINEEIVKHKHSVNLVKYIFDIEILPNN